MKVQLGLYTTLYAAPSFLFEKTLTLVYEPMLAYLYNKPGQHIALYQSSQMMKHIQRERQEYKALIATLSKRGDIEMLSGSWSQTLLSLLPPKDRVSQIERLTSFIRHEYGVLPLSAFFFGEVWQPNYISSLKNAGLDNVVISTYLPYSAEREDKPFVMNELGKKENILPFSDEASLAVKEYSEALIDYDTLRSRLLALLDKKDDFLFIFLNIDQLVLGASREAKGNKPGFLISDILDRATSSSISSINPNKSGYLSSAWYGRDSVSYGLYSFNTLFVHNENFRYLYNRYITLAESTQTRNNRFLKKDVATALFNVALGNLFIHDSELSPLRYTTRRNFWRSIIEAENCFWQYTDGPSFKEYDFEEISRSDMVMANKTYSVVISPKGASSPEFDSLPLGINFFDTRVPFNNSIKHSLNKSFSDIIKVEKDEYDTSSLFFIAEPIDKKRTEILFSLEDDSSLPFQITKRYKLRSNTFILDSTIINKNKKIKGRYELSLYLSAPDSVIVGPEQRMDIVTKGFVESKTVKYGSRLDDSYLTITSTKNFTLTEESNKEKHHTALGEEEFTLYKKITFSFPLEVEADESVTYRLVLRASSSKKDGEKVD